ncbi:hypothetical protein TKK_0007327 [Trichogramma kaykai]|uniref:Odorant receptor n=1 Tax=Trichogramma kaykai TaxID=54128 RepID=A0ABD2X9Y2_9HYME
MADVKREQGFKVAMGIAESIMRFSGIWPGVEKPKINYARFTFIPVMLMILVFVNIPQTIQLFYFDGNLSAILNVLTMADVPISIALVKFLVTSYNHQILNKLLVLLNDDWKHVRDASDIEIMWQKAKTSRKVSKMCMVLSAGTVFAYSGRMLYVLYISTLTNSEDNVDKQIVRPLYFSAKFFYDTQKTPNFEITWILQMIAAFLSALAFGSIDCLFISFILHLCGQLVILQKAFEKIGSDDVLTDANFDYTIAKLIKKHSRINKSVHYIETSFNKSILYQALSSSILFCFQGYLFIIILSTAKDTEALIEVTFMLYFTTCFMFSVFIYCYVAEFLVDESLKLNYSIFYCKWYNLPAKKSRLLIMCLLRVRKPLQVSAGKYVFLSLNLFCHIVRTSAGYISVLLAVREKLFIQ